MVTPLRTAAVAAAGYAVFTLAALALHGWNPLWFVWIGERYASGDPAGRTGYDGQFVYYVARDGAAAVPHLDNPPYRLQRIVYPALVRLASGGDVRAIPWLMLGLNYAAIVATTWMLAAWLQRRGAPPGWALIYAGFVGTVLAYSRDLTEPLAYAFGTAAALLWLAGRRAAAVAVLAVAALSRETTLLIGVALALAELCGRRPRRAAALALAAIPLLAWQALLAAWFGATVLRVGSLMHVVPLAGTLPHLTLEPGRLSALLCVGLPALLLLPVALHRTWREPRCPLWWLLAVHCGFVLVLPDQSYAHVMATGRIALGLVVAVVLAIPALSPTLRRAAAAWAVVPTVPWLLPVLWWSPWTAVR